MSKHETIEAAVLGGVALLFVVAIAFVASSDDRTDAVHAAADQTSPGAVHEPGVTR